MNEIKKEINKNINDFFKGKTLHMIIALNNDKSNKYESILAKEIGCTYSHAVWIVRNLKNIGLIEINKKGRIKFITLTKKGKEIANIIETLFNIIKESKLKK
jgi:Mn-dependent DtxR family transcriptional regulator